MPIGAILEVLTDANWMYRIDKKEMAKLFGAGDIRIDKFPKLPGYYAYSDSKTKRALFAASRFDKSYKEKIYEQLHKEVGKTIEKLEFNAYPGLESCFYESKNQITLVVVKDKTVTLTVFDNSKDHLFQLAKHFEEKRIF